MDNERIQSARQAIRQAIEAVIAEEREASGATSVTESGDARLAIAAFMLVAKDIVAADGSEFSKEQDDLADFCANMLAFIELGRNENCSFCASNAAMRRVMFMIPQVASELNESEQVGSAAHECARQLSTRE